MHNKQSKQIYEKPTLKVVSFMVEHGFAGTGGDTLRSQDGVVAEGLGVNSGNNGISSWSATGTSTSTGGNNNTQESYF